MVAMGTKKKMCLSRQEESGLSQRGREEKRGYIVNEFFLGR